MTKLIRSLILILMIPGTAIVSGEKAFAFNNPQDTVRRVVVKMAAREIPEIPAVDYNKLFKEASPVEARSSKKVVFNKRASANVSRKIVSPGYVAKAPKPVIVAALKPAPAKKTVTKPVEKTKLAVAKPVPAEPVIKPTEKSKLVAAKPVIKIAAKPQATPAKDAFSKSSPAVAEKRATKTLTPEEIIAETKLVSTESRSRTADYKSAAEIVAAGLPVVVKNPSYSQYNESINAEQQKWKGAEASEGSFVEDKTANNMSYLYIGFALTVIGVVLGLVFSRPAYLVSVVGVVLVVIALFVQP